MVVGENKRTANIMDGIENTGDVRLHDHRLRLKQRFDIVRKLGQGTYGKVQLGINKKTGQEVAIKTIKKCKIESEADLIRIRREVQIMSSVRHPNIVHIYEVFENSEKMILVMEYCSGGELYDYLSQKKVLQEDEARRLFRQIATAVYYCHIHKICHRDLKLENVLLDDTGSAKIADFGLSNVFKETSLLSTFCGSPLYASPEIVKGTPYIGPEVDCWSLGVLLYTLVYGAMPFDGSNFKRLVRQISNGDYYEPKNPSSASPLIRDMLTVDPLKRADITYICDNPWVNVGCETSCLEMAEALAAETPVRLDLLLSLAPAAPSNSNSVVVPSEAQMGPEESCTDLTSSASMAVEPSNSAEKRILELVAEGGEDAIKPSPTRTIVSAGDNKRKLELAMSSSGMQRKKERVASAVGIAAPGPALEEEAADLPADTPSPEQTSPPTLKSSATITIQPSPPSAAPATPAPATATASVELVKVPVREVKEAPKESPKEEDAKEKTGAKPRVIIKKKVTPKSSEEKASPEKLDEPKQEETKVSSVASAADKLTSLSLAQQTPTNQTPAKPKKLSFPGGNVGSFKEQFERRASLTTTPEVKKNFSKPASVSKIAKPKAQSEDRELPAKMPDNGTVRLQQIGIEPSQTIPDEHPNRGSVKKTESEPSHGSSSTDPSTLLQDARRSLQNSMAKLVEEKNTEENRRRAARDIISTAIRTGKPPVPYGRSSSAGVTSLASLGSPPATPPTVPAPRVFRTEAQHRVEDHRNRGVSVERIIPINLAGDDSPTSPPPQSKAAPSASAASKPTQQPLRRLVSNESTASEACSAPSGEPIKKSAREFIIPIAVEGKGYVTPRQRSLEPETSSATRLTRTPKPRRISSLVSGGESEEEDEMHMHRLRSTRAARAESVSSGEEDEEDEGFHLLTAENLFSTLLHRVRALTNRLNGEEGPGFQHPHSLFNNLHQSPFFNSPHLPRRHLLREGWGSRDLHADFDTMFSKPRTSLPRGISKKSKHQTKTQQNAEQNTESGLDLSDLDLSSIQLSEAEMRALSGLTPALSRRLQQQLLASLPPAAARSLRRTLSLHDPIATSAPPPRSRSASKAVTSEPTTPATNAPRSDLTDDQTTAPRNEVTEAKDKSSETKVQVSALKTDDSFKEELELSAPQYCTLPRLKRHSTRSRESTPPMSPAGDLGEYAPKISSLSKEPRHSRGSSIRSTPDRPLLSKYLTPERTLSLDESYSSDGGSILSEPSYIAAYGVSSIGNAGLGFRRHSMRLAGEQPRKRISRFLRADFFDSPSDESVYAKHKKEKELETQKILREIREKRNKSLEISDVKSPTETIDRQSTFKDDFALPRKCLSPISPINSILSAKERSRSNTPFFPILDNIKESTLDSSLTTKSNRYGKVDDSNLFNLTEESVLNKESKLSRPKSYPIKNVESFNKPSETDLVECNSIGKDNESKEKTLSRESKLSRPKSYPTSSPSPEKVLISRNVKKVDTQSETPKSIQTEEPPDSIKNDVEVSFSIVLPKKSTKPNEVSKPDLLKKNEPQEQKDDAPVEDTKKLENILILKKYQVMNNISDTQTVNKASENGTANKNNEIINSVEKTSFNEDAKLKVMNHTSKKEDINLKSPDTESNEKKGTIKKKIIKKVSSKTKTDAGSSQEGNGEGKPAAEKKKVTKKVKEKTTDEGTKTTTVTKKKSVLQSIGHKLEKLASTNKSNSPDKLTENSVTSKEIKKAKLSRMQREQSVPVNADPPTESNLIKRAVTLTDVAALDCQNITSSKTTVSKVLGLFKKFEPKEKNLKTVEKSQSDNLEVVAETNGKVESLSDGLSDKFEADKPKRPTSLLLNGLGRKNKYGRSTSDSVSATLIDNDDQSVSKKENNSKNLRNSLKLDFSKLPRVKKIVPTNPVIEPQMMNVTCNEKGVEKKEALEKNGIMTNSKLDASLDNVDSQSRSRSRSRSTYSNSEIKSDNSAETKDSDKNLPSPMDSTVYHPQRIHESTTPEKEDIVDRIHRKSFYSRFNEKKQRRKSNLVGPGAAEYDPVARIHGQPSETKFDMSPTSPVTYDISPGYSVGPDVSPSTERYRSLLTDLSNSTRSNLRFDNYGLNDKIDTYRSLDRNDFRKYPGTRSYLDYDQPSSYTSHRYTRTKSLLDSSDGNEDLNISSLRDPHKYNRTISMYSPGSYATYRPKRTRNSAIILKESEKEPSPENILEKIRNRKKISISVTRKPDSEKEPLTRSDGPFKGEGDGAECSEKVD